MKELQTWAGRSAFRYTGSVRDGTTIHFGEGRKVMISTEQYRAMLELFSGSKVNIGTSRDKAPRGSLGDWLFENVDSRAIASYVGAILVEEGYAVKSAPSIIFFH